MSAQAIEENIIPVHLAVYDSLRTEQLKRIDSQNQSINYLLIVLGVSATVVASSVGRPEYMTMIIFWTFLLLPIIASPLAFLFFDHEMAIHSIGNHLYFIWYDENMKKALGAMPIFENSLLFYKLHHSSRKIHTTLSLSRYTLFLIPTILPVIYTGLYTGLNWGWWQKYKGGLLGELSTSFVPLAFILWVIGLLAAILISFAAVWGVIKHEASVKSIRGAMRKRVRDFIAEIKNSASANSGDGK